jgi:hypothetical protein
VWPLVVAPRSHLGREMHSTVVRSKTGLRTLTLLYDRRMAEVATAHRVWKLLSEARHVMESSLQGLQLLFRTLRASCRSPEHSLLEESSFRRALLRYGARDPILITRLFDEVPHPHPNPKPLTHHEALLRGAGCAKLWDDPPSRAACCPL